MRDKFCIWNVDIVVHLENAEKLLCLWYPKSLYLYQLCLHWISHWNWYGTVNSFPVRSAHSKFRIQMMFMPHIGCNLHTWHSCIQTQQNDRFDRKVQMKYDLWFSRCILCMTMSCGGLQFQSMVSIPLVFNVQLCHKSVVKRWNESRLHSIWCTPAKALVIPCSVFIALFFNSKLSTHSNLLRFIIVANRIRSFEKFTMPNNVTDNETRRWKRHIDAFLSFYFVVVVCSSSVRPWHPFKINEHTWTISLIRWTKNGFRCFHWNLCGFFFSVPFSCVWSCQNRWLCGTRPEYWHSFVKHVAKEWKTAHISSSRRHKHNLIDTFLCGFTRSNGKQRTDSCVVLRRKWFCLHTYKRQYHKLFMLLGWWEKI